MTADRPRFNDTDPSERWMTVYEVAAQLLARPETVRRWLEDGGLRAEDRGRLGRRIPKSALDAFINKQFQTGGFRTADHALSSGVGEDVLTATEIPEQALVRQGAGWPFRKDAPSVY